ncbi:MAG: hypothetical protein A3E01_09415 [Gammaproteobacteria bacterium RIFCSPHIGHO2_12_FULL_63_22]|nr:MAG: hypothetical protein A3E01_09415 [Gammaproteobacteria bacterium RIFCSPHIGHO2_12_FULL_63_22]
MPTRYDYEPATTRTIEEWLQVDLASDPGYAMYAAGLIPLGELPAFNVENFYRNVLQPGATVTYPAKVGSAFYNQRLPEGRPTDPEGHFDYVEFAKSADGKTVSNRRVYLSQYEIVAKKKGFLGGATGGLFGAIVGLALAAPTGGASLTWSAAALAAGSGAALGTIAGTGAEAAISGTQFEIGDVLKSAAIAGGVAAVGAGVTSGLSGPTTSVASTSLTTTLEQGTISAAKSTLSSSLNFFEGTAALGSSSLNFGAGTALTTTLAEGTAALGAALQEGTAGLSVASITSPGLVSPPTAKALAGVASTITRTALAPLSASLSDAVAPVARVAAVSYPIAGGAINTTGSTWFNYGNTVDVPTAQPVGFFDSILDSILPPFMNPNDPAIPGTPGDGGSTPTGGAVTAIVAAVLIIGGAAAFAHARAKG